MGQRERSPNVSLVSGTCEALSYSGRAKFSEARNRRQRRFAHAHALRENNDTASCYILQSLAQTIMHVCILGITNKISKLLRVRSISNDSQRICKYPSRLRLFLKAKFMQ